MKINIVFIKWIILRQNNKYSTSNKTCQSGHGERHVQGITDLLCCEWSSNRGLSFAKSIGLFIM